MDDFSRDGIDRPRRGRNGVSRARGLATSARRDCILRTGQARALNTRVGTVDHSCQINPVETSCGHGFSEGTYKIQLSRWVGARACMNHNAARHGELVPFLTGRKKGHEHRVDCMSLPGGKPSYHGGLAREVLGKALVPRVRLCSNLFSGLSQSRRTHPGRLGIVSYSLCMDEYVAHVQASTVHYLPFGHIDQVILVPLGACASMLKLRPLEAQLPRQQQISHLIAQHGNIKILVSACGTSTIAGRRTASLHSSGSCRHVFTRPTRQAKTAPHTPAHR